MSFICILPDQSCSRQESEVPALRDTCQSASSVQSHMAHIQISITHPCRCGYAHHYQQALCRCSGAVHNALALMSSGHPCAALKQSIPVSPSQLLVGSRNALSVRTQIGGCCSRRQALHYHDKPVPVQIPLSQDMLHTGDAVPSPPPPPPPPPPPSSLAHTPPGRQGPLQPGRPCCCWRL